MGALKYFAAVVEEFKDRADFITIYIEEIHAADGWSFESSRFNFKTHKTLQDRFYAASIFKSEFDCNECALFVDSISNEANFAYGGLPERLAIIKNGRIHYIGGIGPMMYDITEMKKSLNEALNLPY
uniref:Iodothyronine deiodinase n=2 Tax=Ciona intestinalis TaxID=7719 RepID=H2XKZ2_CIOIN